MKTLAAMVVLLAFAPRVANPQLSCDPLNLNGCPVPGEFCHVNIFSETADCATIGAEPPGQQYEICVFLNGCDAGLGCMLRDPAQNFSLTCAHYCDPATGQTAQGGNCRDVPQLPAESAFCARLDEFYIDSNLSLGMCIDCVIHPQSIACNRLFANGFES